jgi:hypothetical protein
MNEKMSLCLIRYHAMLAKGKAEVKLHIFLKSGPEGGSQLHVSNQFNTNAYQTGGGVGPKNR